MDFAQLSCRYEKIKFTDDGGVCGLLEEMRLLAERSGNAQMLGRYDFYYADWLFNREKVKEAYAVCLDCISLLMGQPYCRELPYCYNLLGAIYAVRGDKLLALDYYLNGLSYAQKAGEQDVVSAVSNNIGLLYDAMGDYEKSMEFLKRAFEAVRCKEEKDAKAFVVCLNLAGVSLRRGDLEASWRYLELAGEYYFEELGGRYDLNMRITQCRLYDAGGMREESAAAFDEVIAMLERGMFTADMFQEMIDLTQLKVKTEDREKLRYVLSILDDIVGGYKNADYALEVCGLWCEFFERFGEREYYAQATQRYFCLSRKRNDEMKRLLLEAADIKFNLNQLQKKHRKTAREAAELQRKVMRDSLTGLYSRTAMTEVFEPQFERAKERGEGVCAAIVDVDFFKEYNDTYGHPRGDRCLRHIGGLMERMNGEGVFFMRYGGDEFLALFCGMNPERVESLLKLLQAEMKALYICHEGRPAGEKIVTLTLGAYYGFPRRGEFLNNYIRRADEALYEGKRTRNKLVLRTERDGVRGPETGAVRIDSAV